VEVVTVKEILQAMEAGETFSLTVISYNRKEKAGGKLVEYHEARLHKRGEADGTGGRSSTKVETMQETLKNPEHRKWYTRNIQILQDGFPTSIIRKIHPPLIIEFNGKKVVP
jgi:hypothetical protein